MLSYSSSDTQSFTAASSASLREGIDILKERADGLIIEEERTNRNDLLLLDVLKRFDQKFLMTFGWQKLEPKIVPCDVIEWEAWYLLNKHWCKYLVDAAAKTDTSLSPI